MSKTIYADNQPLTLGKKYTFLSGDVVAGASVINVISTLGFNSLTTSSGQVLMVGELGNEKTEIISTSNVSTSTGTNISGTGATLRTSLRFDHPQDTKVFIINFDRFEVQYAATVTGTKATLMAYPEQLQPDQFESIYRDSTQTGGFYFIRFNTTIDSTNSDWSDAIPYQGYADNSVNQIKLRALERAGEVVDGQVITDEFLNRCLWEARREYHQSPGKRPFRRRFNRVIGSALTGSYRIELPNDVEKPYTAENVYGVRVGANPNMQYIDKKEWDFMYIGKPHSTLALPYTAGVSTSIWLDNGRDFQSPSGALTVEGTVIEYTQVSGSQNSLTITSHGSWDASGGSDVWQNASFGLPDRFTVWADVLGSAYVYFNRPFDTSYINQNIFADYYRTVVAMDSDADELDEPGFDFFVPYLAARIRLKRNPGMKLLEDSDWLMWLQGKQDALNKEYAGTPIRLIPEIRHLEDY